MSLPEYNGWVNYPTWNVALWLDNEEGSDTYWRERAREIWKDAEATKHSTKKQMAVRTLAEALKDEHEENMPEVTGVYSDLLTWAFGHVEWLEIAEHYMDDMEKESGDE